MLAMFRREILVGLPYNMMFLILVPILYLISNNMSPFPIIFGFFVGLFAALFYYDQQNGVNKFLVSLPVSRKAIINARYVYSLILLICAHLYIFLIDHLANRFLPYYDGEALTVQTTYFYLCTTLTITAIFLPIFVKFKYLTAFAIKFVSIILIPSITFWVMNKLLTEATNQSQLKNLLNYILNVYTANPILISIILVALIYFISLLLSQWIYSKKEFS